MKLTLEQEIAYFNTLCEWYSQEKLDLLGFIERYKELKLFHEFVGLELKSK